MNTVWLAATTMALIHPKMNEAERYEALAPYVSPAPGKSASLSSLAISRLRQSEDPLAVEGTIVITPPKGQCFTVTKHKSLPDLRICEQTAVSFNGYMLREDGSIRWTISTGPSDPGYEYRFPTPHRVAKVIGMGERPKNLYNHELILNCEAYTEAGDRRVVFDVVKDKKWVVRFPKEDVYKRSPDPNNANDILFDAFAPEKEEGIGRLETQEDPRKRAKVHAQKKEPVTRYWMNPEYGAYTMPASNFTTVDTPDGSKGECLYQYEGAYRDPLSGWLECRHADEYDVIYFSSPCIRKILTAKKDQL